MYVFLLFCIMRALTKKCQTHYVKFIFPAIYYSTVIRDLPAQGIDFDDRQTSNQQEIAERKPLSL